MTTEQRERVSKAHFGHAPWNKGKNGFIHSASFKKGHGDLVPKESRIEAGKKHSNELHPNWAGDDVGYSALHVWVKRHFGRPIRCENCGKPNAEEGKLSIIHWANISGLYKRDRDDWMNLCVKCHFIFDEHPYHAK